MKLILVSPKNRTVYNFRGELVKRIQSEDLEKIESLDGRLKKSKKKRVLTLFRYKANI